MKCNYKNKVTHSIKITPGEIFVSIGYISLFIGLSTTRLHSILRGAEHINNGKRRLYPFGATLLFIMKYNSFKYSKYLTNNGKNMKYIQGIKK
jgi:hypothetical protein